MLEILRRMLTVNPIERCDVAQARHCVESLRKGNSLPPRKTHDQMTFPRPPSTDGMLGGSESDLNSPLWNHSVNDSGALFQPHDINNEKGRLTDYSAGSVGGGSSDGTEWLEFHAESSDGSNVRRRVERGVDEAGKRLLPMRKRKPRRRKKVDPLNLGAASSSQQDDQFAEWTLGLINRLSTRSLNPIGSDSEEENPLPLRQPSLRDFDLAPPRGIRWKSSKSKRNGSHQHQQPFSRSVGVLELEQAPRQDPLTQNSFSMSMNAELPSFLVSSQTKPSNEILQHNRIQFPPDNLAPKEESRAERTVNIGLKATNGFVEENKSTLDNESPAKFSPQVLMSGDRIAGVIDKQFQKSLDTFGDMRIFDTTKNSEGKPKKLKEKRDKVRSSSKSPRSSRPSMSAKNESDQIEYDIQDVKNKERIIASAKMKATKSKKPAKADTDQSSSTSGFGAQSFEDEVIPKSPIEDEDQERVVNIALGGVQSMSSPPVGPQLGGNPRPSLGLSRSENVEILNNTTTQRTKTNTSGSVPALDFDFRVVENWISAKTDALLSEQDSPTPETKANGLLNHLTKKTESDDDSDANNTMPSTWDLNHAANWVSSLTGATLHQGKKKKSTVPTTMAPSSLLNTIGASSDESDDGSILAFTSEPLKRAHSTNLDEFLTPSLRVNTELSSGRSVVSDGELKSGEKSSSNEHTFDSEAAEAATPESSERHEAKEKWKKPRPPRAKTSTWALYDARNHEDGVTELDLVIPLHAGDDSAPNPRVERPKDDTNNDGNHQKLYTPIGNDKKTYEKNTRIEEESEVLPAESKNQKLVELNDSKVLSSPLRERKAKKKTKERSRSPYSPYLSRYEGGAEENRFLLNDQSIVRQDLSQFRSSPTPGKRFFSEGSIQDLEVDRSGSMATILQLHSAILPGERVFSEGLVESHDQEEAESDEDYFFTRLLPEPPLSREEALDSKREKKEKKKKRSKESKKKSKTERSLRRSKNQMLAEDAKHALNCYSQLLPMTATDLKDDQTRMTHLIHHIPLEEPSESAS